MYNEVKLPDKDTQDAIKTTVNAIKSAVNTGNPNNVVLAPKSTLDAVATNVSTNLTTTSSVNIYCGRIDTYVKTINNNIGTSADAANSIGTTIFSLLKYLAAAGGTGGDSSISDALNSIITTINTTINAWNPNNVVLAPKSTLDAVATNVSTNLTTTSSVNVYSGRIDTNVKTVNTNMGTSADAASNSGATIFSLLKYIASRV